MNENIEKVLATLDGFRMSDEMTYSAYSVLYDEISLLDDLLKALEPQPPKHIHEEYPEHDWERKKDRSIDEFAMESDFHNGPRCKRCYDTFCVHCVPDGYETHKPCIIDEDRCPKCGNKLFPPFGKARKITYCANCGQAVKWE